MITNETIFHTVCQVLNKKELTPEDILSVRDLDLCRKDLTEISDLTQFHKLERLHLTENCITDFSPLAGLTSLRELHCGNDPFLSDMEKCARQGKNQITDFSFLKELPKLSYLEMTDMGIESVDFVSMTPNLTEFWAYCNPIRDIAPLEHCNKLKKCYFYACPITGIDVCRKLPSLIGIAINNTNVSDLSPLADHPHFSYLDAHDARITDLSPLAGMEKLNYLTLVGNQISDITPLKGLTELRWLTLEVGDCLTYEQLAAVLPSLTGLYTVALDNARFTKPQEKSLREKMRGVTIRFDESGAL